MFVGAHHTRKGGTVKPTTKYIMVVSKHHTETQEKLEQRIQQQSMLVTFEQKHKEWCTRATKCN
jgi:hypothetical protein